MRYYFSTSNIYVSQLTGNDLNNGLTPDNQGQAVGPLKTMERALSKVADLRSSGDTRPVRIMLVDDYYMDKPLEISENTPGHNFYRSIDADNFIIESYGSRKSFIGGRKLSGWKKATLNGRDCYSVQLEKDVNGNYPDFTDLFINGDRADYTRFPADESLLTAVDTEVNDGIDFGKCSRWFIANKEDYHIFKGEKNALINYWHCWIHEQNPVKSFDEETGRVDFEYKTRLCINTNYKEDSCFALRYFVENVKIGFTKPNQWYYDVENGVVYYMPKEGLDIENAEIYYPLTEQLFVIKGTREKPLDRISFRNLEFKCTKGDNYSRIEPDADDPNWTLDVPSGMACDGQGVSVAHGAIEYAWASNGFISDCKFSGLGVYAINILQGCNNMRIENNEICQISGGGIKVNGGTVNNTIESRTHSNTIKGNYIHHICLRNWSAIGILVKHSYNNIIEENEICYTEYSAISVGWVWGYGPSVSRDNIIRNNYLHDIGGDRLNDMGGIYLLGRQPGTIISGNRIINVKGYKHMAWGIYLDEGSAGITVENNVIANTLSPGFVMHFGTHNVVRNNVFAFGSQGGFAVNRIEFHNSVIFENNIFLLNDVPFAENSLWRLLNCAVLNDNLVWDIANPEPYITGDDKVKIPVSEAVKNYPIFNLVVADPMFEDYKNLDFTLKEGSPAEKIGFRPIKGFTASGKR